MQRLVMTSAIAVVLAAALLTGSGVGSSATAAGGARDIPAGLAAAIHARLGGAAIGFGSAARVTPGPSFGVALALSADGTTALVGAPRADNGAGAAYVFHVSDAGSWTSSDTPAAVLQNAHPLSTPQLFGIGVALSADGTTAFVSADADGTGAAYVFRASAEDAWTSTSTPKAALTGVEIYSGLAVSQDGTTLVAGAPFYNASGGRAAVYHASSESAWASMSSPTAVLINGTQSSSDETGASVALSADGTTALISNSANSNGGGAYVFHAASESTWTTTGKPAAILYDHRLAYGDDLGSSVALSADGTVAFLAAPRVNSSTGQVDVYRASGEASWASTATPTATLTNAGAVAGDGFGTRLAVSSDGTTALVTAYGVASGRGAAYVYRVAGEGSWASTSTPTATLTNAGAPAGVELEAAALSADGATALAGAPFGLLQPGAAYVFHVPGASSWTSSTSPNAILTAKELAACVVPKLTGLKLSSAKTALLGALCQLGTVSKVRSRTKNRGRVLSQGAKPGTRLAIGAKIAVKIGK